MLIYSICEIQFYATRRQSFPLEPCGTYQYALLVKMELLIVAVGRNNHWPLKRYTQLTVVLSRMSGH